MAFKECFTPVIAAPKFGHREKRDFVIPNHAD